MIKSLHLSAATLIAAGALVLNAGSASAATQEVAFKATFSGQVAVTSPTAVAFSGAGSATQLGHITTSGHVDITGFDDSCPGGVANAHVERLTDNDGDALTITAQDVSCPTATPGLYDGVGHWTVSGGTGRFINTNGQGSLGGFADFVAGTFTITLTGTITPASS